MPLLVPEITSSSGGDSHQDEWISKLLGKKLTDSASDHSVSERSLFHSDHYLSRELA